MYRTKGKAMKRLADYDLTGLDSDTASVQAERINSVARILAPTAKLVNGHVVHVYAMGYAQGAGLDNPTRGRRERNLTTVDGE